jgi:hypothetical protein
VQNRTVKAISADVSLSKKCLMGIGKKGHQWK